MVLEQDFYYWSIINNLVINHKYSIIAISQDGSEILLQPYRHKQFTIVRLKRMDVDWGNTLGIDIEQAGQKFQHLLRNGVRGPIHVMNIYISTLPPVDDYPSSFEKGFSLEKGKIDITSILLTSDQRESGLKKLEEVLHIPFKIDIQAPIEMEDIQKIKNQVISYNNEMREEEKKMFNHGKPFFTYIFLGLQIVMFLLLELYGGSTNNDTLIKFGAKFNPLIYEGEWWRFFAPVVLHIGFFHLFMNSLALYYIGPAVEKAFGSLRFLFIYIIAGVAGTFASFAFSPSISAGASGAIFGCFGALLYIGVQNKQVFLRTIGPNIIVVIGINLAMGFVIPNIDNAGHIGGLVGGFLTALLLQLPKKNQPIIRLIGLTSLLILFFSLFYFGQDKARDQYIQYTAFKGQEMLQNEQIEEAYTLLNEAVIKQHSSNEVLLLLSVAEIELGKYDDASKHLQQILSNDDSYHQANFYLAILLASSGNETSALESINKAIQLEPSNEDYQALKKEIIKSQEEND